MTSLKDIIIGIVLIVSFVQIECTLSEKWKNQEAHSIVNNESVSLQHNDQLSVPFTSKSLTLEERLEIEKSTFHWYPYKKILYEIEADGTLEELCLDRPSSIDEFPQDLFTQQQRIRGAILLHFLGAIYFFIILAMICDKYFLPCVECICESLGISPDVAACTFMATATTMPEFFNNTISTFVADSDMGLGAIIGSMLFNTLGVAACASLFTKRPIQIDWWPITRDASIFAINVSVLVAMAWDGAIMWYETCILVAMYVLYFILMFQNPRIMRVMKKFVEERMMWCQRIKNYDIANQRPYPTKSEQQIEAAADNGRGIDNAGFNGSTDSVNGKREEPSGVSVVIPPKPMIAPPINQLDDEEFHVWQLPESGSIISNIWYFFTWPIRFCLHYTVPNPATHPKWFPLTFVLCILWIGGTSYFVFWMVVVIGYTFGIPEPIMGLTFLAFGGCMPEAISAVIVARKGSGQFGVSNALGANSLAVLFSLGLPWFIRTMADGAGSTGAFIQIFSHGIEFTIISLILAVGTLYLVISIAGYKLRKTVGCILIVAYVFFVTFAILVELDVFFEAPDRC